MNRNVTILIIILIILLLSGYLLMLRNRFQQSNNQKLAPVVENQVPVTPSPTMATIISSSSANASPSGKISPTIKSVSTSSGSGSKIK